ncbi:putative RNA helicase [Helianthus annuus]|uniref:RNA helicase n=1 Tax=Helianthus annuus TaxID=4232 RepID=A0A251VBE7_HELAN|nr:DEAD-box ATP-dependent RNA helicase 47, mitochondrial [Helianthus annuus]KAF5816394.1 putative RNA helicase [Helianthus annuus]KAJ0769788.1 putative RNA helicase [Helianthus annuus]
MAALVATRFLFLVGDTLSIKKLPKISKAASFHKSAYILNRFGTTHGPLTLESLGFKNRDEPTAKLETNKVRPTVSTLQVIQGQVEEEVKIKRVKVKPKAVAVENPIEIESAPFSAKSFSELGLPPLLIEALEREGFNVPTDVQSAAIPTVRNNHDVVIQSYTGSGKTLAYVLPILSEVGPLKGSGSPVDNKESGKKTDIEAVIIVPSRELGMQIVREIEKLLGPENKKFVQQLVGGANRSRQEEALRKNKPVIVVGTPGRIAEISAAGKLHTHGCRHLVLDEIDQLLSFNFREDMHRIVEHVGKKPSSGLAQNSETVVKKRVERQTIMVSATVPFAVVRAARSWGCEPMLVQAKKVSPLESVSRPPGPVNLSPGPNPGSDLQQSDGVSESLPPSLKHYYCLSRMQHKVDTVRRCVHALNAKTVIVFMNHTRQLKDAVYKLQARGLVAEELHGDLGKLARSTILKKFKKGEIRVLVTNELSARGLDVSNCDLVVNVDLPTDSVHYAHRAGRTGRLGRKGSVVTICEESEVFVVKKLQRRLGVQFQSCEFVEGKLVIQEEK